MLLNTSKISIFKRPCCPVLTVTSKSYVARFLGIVRGLFSIRFEDTSNINSVISFSNDFLLDTKIISQNVNILFLSGLQESKSGTTDQMRVINVNDYYNQYQKF